MKKRLVKALTTVSFAMTLAMLSFGSAQGQSSQYPIRFHIPFEFQVAEKKLPAGDYFVGRVLEHSSTTALTISSVDGRHTAIRLTSPVQTLTAKKRGTLVFHRYGEQHFLFQVWPAGAQTGRVLPKSRSERELEQKVQDVAGTLTKPSSTTETVNIVGGPQ